MAKVSSSPRKSKRKSIQKRKKKSVYRVGNWSAYNESLKQRGSLTFWFDEKVIKNWNYQGPSQQGAQYVYSNRFNLPQVIQLALASNGRLS
jgi:hypothetical protein